MWYPDGHCVVAKRFGLGQLTFEREARVTLSQQTPKRCRLGALPNEIKALVLEKLDPESYLKMAQVDRDWAEQTAVTSLLRGQLAHVMPMPLASPQSAPHLVPPSPAYYRALLKQQLTLRDACYQSEAARLRALTWSECLDFLSP